MDIIEETLREMEDLAVHREHLKDLREHAASGTHLSRKQLPQTDPGVSLTTCQQVSTSKPPQNAAGRHSHVLGVCRGSVE